MRNEDLEDMLINKFDQYFQKIAKDYVVKSSTNTPFLEMIIEMTLYNYYIVRVNVEKSTIFFSIVQSGFLLQLFKTSLSEDDLDAALLTLANEVKLRIPDKYLQAKGWE
ncbi:MAG: hypothetical protein P8X74_19550 [Reinekea sp.]